MKITLITLGTLAALSSTALAAPLHAAKTMPTAAKKVALLCPVTGTKISSIKTAVGHSTYKGKTYYFCCPECKPAFDKNPGKIVANAAKGKYQKM